MGLCEDVWYVGRQIRIIIFLDMTKFPNHVAKFFGSFLVTHIWANIVKVLLEQIESTIGIYQFISTLSTKLGNLRVRSGGYWFFFV